MAWFGYLHKYVQQRWLLGASVVWRSSILVALLLHITYGSLAHAIPTLTLQQPPNQSADQAFATIDLRKRWESAVVAVGEQPNTQAFEPQEVWLWSETKFAQVNEPGQIVLTAKQRFVARLELVSPSSGDGIYLNFKMPRLDAVHVAYRYNQGPWVKVAAGDTLPMQTWPFPDRQPAFDIPLLAGNLSLVVEIAHRGEIDAPMVLQNANAFRHEGLNAALRAGLLIGINLVLVVVGVLAAWSFRRLGFLSISLMTLLMACVVSSNSGLAGIYAFTDSSEFNDQFKFFSNSLWCVVFPWVAATVLSQRLYARWLWLVSSIWAVVGILATVWWMPYALRDASNQGVAAMAMASVAFAMCIAFNALLRNQVYALVSLMGVLLYATSLALRLAAQKNLISAEDAIFYASLATLAAALIFLQVLIKQHRQGRLVMSRAQISSGRDVLTGLLSRQGFEKVLAKNMNRIFAEKSYAAFFYISVSDAQSLQQQYGDEGFEVGMVQMAAAISSSISVVDMVGRVASNAFAVTVMMPRDAKLANALAQKIITRTMALATHVSPMAQTARVAIAWLPVFGTLLPDIERRAQRTLQKIEIGKRIAWVGGADAQSDTLQMPSGTSNPNSNPASRPHNGQSADGDLLSLPGTINRIEHEMLGPQNQTLKVDNERLMRVMKKYAPRDNYVNTKIEPHDSQPN